MLDRTRYKIELNGFHVKWNKPRRHIKLLNNLSQTLYNKNISLVLLWQLASPKFSLALKNIVNSLTLLQVPVSSLPIYAFTVQIWLKNADNKLNLLKEKVWVKKKKRSNLPFEEERVFGKGTMEALRQIYIIKNAYKNPTEIQLKLAFPTGRRIWVDYNGQGRGQYKRKESNKHTDLVYVPFSSHRIHNIPQKIQFSCPVLAC